MKKNKFAFSIPQGVENEGQVVIEHRKQHTFVIESEEECRSRISIKYGGQDTTITLCPLGHWESRETSFVGDSGSEGKVYGLAVATFEKLDQNGKVVPKSRTEIRLRLITPQAKHEAASIANLVMEGVPDSSGSN